MTRQDLLELITDGAKRKKLVGDIDSFVGDYDSLVCIIGSFVDNTVELATRIRPLVQMVKPS